MSIQVRWIKDETVVRAQLGVTSAKIFAALKVQLQISFGELREYIVGTKLEGQVLHHRTGNLINSTQPYFRQTGMILEAGVAVGPEAPYGKWQEYGAHIPERFSVRKLAMHWIGADGKDVFAKRARAFDLPPRSFMVSSFREQREKIIADLGAAMVAAVKS